MNSLFEDLKKLFNNYCIIPDKKKILKFTYPSGIMFYGPPGTGKTQLTEDLP